jgi:hypothetical protein
MSGEAPLEDMELSSPRPGVVVMNHAPHLCEGGFCPIHNPSNHHMRDWPITFRSDRTVWCPACEREHGLVLTERICDCGIGHPDPDSLAYLNLHAPGGWGTHGCCGCCAPQKENP